MKCPTCGQNTTVIWGDKDVHSMHGWRMRAEARLRDAEDDLHAWKVEFDGHDAAEVSQIVADAEAEARMTRDDLRDAEAKASSFDRAFERGQELEHEQDILLRKLRDAEGREARVKEWGAELFAGHTPETHRDEAKACMACRFTALFADVPVLSDADREAICEGVQAVKEGRVTPWKT